MKSPEEIFHLYLKGEKVHEDELVIDKDYMRSNIDKSRELIKKLKDIDLLDYPSGKELLSTSTTLVALLEMALDYFEYQEDINAS